MLPIVAIIGKPNVGKSTLFNRIIGYRKAIVSPVAGTTRDRHYARIDGDKPYMLVDTGGIEYEHNDIISENIRSQALLAVQEAHCIVFLIDVKNGMTSEDHAVVEILRKSKKPCILVASKSDSQQEDISDLYSLGLGNPIRISAVHLIGLGELRESLESILPITNTPPPDSNAINIAIVGRPNVGKSSLINHYLGEQRLIVSDISGTTVDSTDIELEYEDTLYRLVDTAGIKRRGKIEPGVEKYSFLRSLTASQQADVCVLMIDAEEGVTAQDQHVASYLLENTPGVILAVNKIDLFAEVPEELDFVLSLLKHKFEFMPCAAVATLSAKTGKNAHKILELAKTIKNNRSKRIETSTLNRWLELTAHKHKPNGTGKKIPKMFYMTQVDVHPPRFVLSVNNEEYFHFSYWRYLENKLRDSFDFSGTAIKIEKNSKEKRYGKKKKK